MKIIFYDMYNILSVIFIIDALHLVILIFF